MVQVVQMVRQVQVIHSITNQSLMLSLVSKTSQFDMSALTDMFNTQFDQLRSEFATRDPIQLAQLGRAYGGDAIRARQRNRRSSRDYRRGMANSAFSPAAANLAIGGGLTL